MITAVVPHSPAAAAGLQQCDVVVKAGNDDITEQCTLDDVIDTLKPGDTLDLQVWRNGSNQTVSVRLGNI